MKTITIKFLNGRENIEVQAKDFKSAIEQLVKQKTDLSGADLTKANLSRADLKGAYLRRAYLKYANLSDVDLFETDLSEAYLAGADLTKANLSRADLKGAYLYGAGLSEANLSGANLAGADLFRADLKDADLYRADLEGADLYEADLSGAYLYGADLTDANLSRADLTDVKGLYYQICPEKGSFIAYKATTTGIIKIEISEDAKRTSCIGSKKCRASKILVLDGDGCGGSSPTYTDKPLIYNKGVIIEADSFNDDPRNECTNGIHFFMSKDEALDWFNHI